MSRRLPAEWEEQDGVLLAWPHEQTDWAEQLNEVQECYCKIIRTISRFESVLLIVPEKPPVLRQLEKAGISLKQVSLYELPYNDTWTRDFGPLVIEENGHPRLLDFVFNGWGKKYSSASDNRATASLVRQGAFGTTLHQRLDLVLEGGSIESDGAGTLLTTSSCLLERNRNPHLSQTDIERELLGVFGAEQLHWLENGALEGDDTDGHIDTLARLGPQDTILFQGCQDRQDSHYASLLAMRKELEALRSRCGSPYRLIELPWPQACHDAEGNRLPATYVNYLVINGAVLVPCYDDAADASALEQIAQVFPDREVIGLDCRSLIQQHGSLHCITMQLPKGVLP